MRFAELDFKLLEGPILEQADQRGTLPPLANSVEQSAKKEAQYHAE